MNFYLQSQLHDGLYVDDFVFYLYDPSQEELLKNLIQYQIQVDLRINIDCFLGTEINCLQHTDGNIAVHLCQSAFPEFNTYHFSVHGANKLPNMTPYSSGFLID